MRNKDFLILIKAWTELRNDHNVVNRLAREARREEKFLRKVSIYIDRGFVITSLHREMNHILQDCDLSIKEEILKKTEAWASQAKVYMDEDDEFGLSTLLIPRRSLVGEPNSLTVLVNRVGSYINKDQENKPISGILHFHSETGTEGGYWAFQDKRFITPAGLDEEYDHWNYRGLHILENGDMLTIFDDKRMISILWDGVIRLKNLGLFNESAFGWWIHSDQKGINREIWAKWFFNEKPAQLITVNPLLEMSSA